MARVPSACPRSATSVRTSARPTPSVTIARVTWSLFDSTTSGGEKPSSRNRDSLRERTRERAKLQRAIQHFLGFSLQQLAGRRGLEAVALAMEQRDLQRFLEGADMRARGGLADVQALGGSGQVPFLRSGNEG